MSEAKIALMAGNEVVQRPAAQLPVGRAVTPATTSSASERFRSQHTHAYSQTSDVLYGCLSSLDLGDVVVDEWRTVVTELEQVMAEELRRRIVGHVTAAHAFELPPHSAAPAEAVDAAMADRPARRRVAAVGPQ